MRARRSARRRDAVAALAISLAVHGLLLFALVQARRAGPPGAAPLAFELVTLPPPPAAPSTSPATPPPTAPPPSTPTPTSTSTSTATATSTSTATSTATSPSPSPSRDPSAALAWLRSNGLAPLDRPLAPGALATPVPESLRPEPPDPAREADRVLSGLTAGVRAADLARYPDGSWMELRDALSSGFDPGFDVLDEAGGKGVGAFLSDAARAYAAAAGRYGRSGSPYDDGPGAPGRAGAARAAIAAAGAAGSRERESLLASGEPLGAGPGASEPGPWTRRLATVIAVEQDAEGRVVSARVASASGSAAHDRLALAQALKLVGRKATPQLAASLTEWSFVTDFSMVPPVPVVAVGFDAYFRPTEVVYPLKRTTRTHLRLVAVRRAR